MIGKITTGKDFSGLVNYLLDPSKTPQLIGSNIISQERKEIIEELNWIAGFNTRCKNPVKHISIGFAPEDGEVFDQTVYDIVDAILEGLGYDDNQFMIVRHDRVDPSHSHDHNHDHFHILINSINLDGKRVKDSFDKTKLERILREQELEHNLTIVPSSKERKHKLPHSNQVQRMTRELKERKSQNSQEPIDAPYTSKIQAGIDLASYDRPSLAVFIARLQRLKIDTQFRINKKDRKVTGVSYRMQDFKVKGSKLHDASFNCLLKHRVNYNPQTDIDAIVSANAKEEIPLPKELEVNWGRTNIRNYFPKKLSQQLDDWYGEKSVHPLVTAKSQQTNKNLKSKSQLEKDKDWDLEL